MTDKIVKIEVIVDGGKADQAFKGVDAGAAEMARGVVDGFGKATTAAKSLDTTVAKVGESAKVTAQSLRDSGVTISRTYKEAVVDAKGLGTTVEKVDGAAKVTAQSLKDAGVTISRVYKEATSEVAKTASAINAVNAAASGTPGRGQSAAARGIPTSAQSFANLNTQIDPSRRLNAAFASLEAKRGLKDQIDQTKQATEETKKLGAEGAKNDSIFAKFSSKAGGILQGLLIRDAFKEGIGLAIQFGEALVAAFDKAYLGQKLLLATSVDYGESVNTNINAAYKLASANGALIVSTQAIVSALAPIAERAGKQGEIAKLSQAVLDLAARRGISAEDAAKAVQNPEQLLGESRDFINFQFAKKNGLDPTQLSEQQKALAIVEELFRRGANAAGEFKKENDSLVGSLRQLGTLPGALNVLDNNPNFAAGLGGPGVVLRALKKIAVDPLPPSTAEVKNLQKESDDQAKRLADFNAFEEQRKQGELSRKRFEVSVEAASGRENPQQKLDELRSLQGEIERLRGAILPEDFERISERIVNGIIQVERRLQSLRVESAGVVNDLTSKILTDNPYVKLAVDGEKAIDHIRDHFKDLGSSTVAEMVRMQEAVNATQLQIQRFDTSLGALKNRQEADRLRQRFVGLTGPEERRQAVIDARINAATKGEDLRRTARDLESPYRYKAPDQNIRDIADRVRNLNALDVSGSGRKGKEDVATAIIDATKGIDPRLLATSTDPRLREIKRQVIAANRVKADSFDADTKDAVERERAGNQLQTNAREQLKLLQASDLPSSQKLKQFIAITGQISDKDLTGDLRLGRAKALDLQAQKDSQHEAALYGDDKGRGGLITTLLNLLGPNGSGIPVNIGKAGINVNFALNDGLTVNQQLGAAPTPADTAAQSAGFTPGTRSPGSDF